VELMAHIDLARARWLKELCLKCPCLQVDGCDPCPRRPADGKRCEEYPKDMCDPWDCVLARLEHRALAAETQLAAYREALEEGIRHICRRCRVNADDCPGWPVVKQCGDFASLAQTLLASSAGQGVVERLRAGERVAKVLHELRDAHDWPAPSRLWAALADYDKVVRRDG